MHWGPVSTLAWCRATASGPRMCGGHSLRAQNDAVRQRGGAVAERFCRQDRDAWQGALAPAAIGQLRETSVGVEQAGHILAAHEVDHLLGAPAEGRQHLFSRPPPQLLVDVGVRLEHAGEVAHLHVRGRLLRTAPQGDPEVLPWLPPQRAVRVQDGGQLPRAHVLGHVLRPPIQGCPEGLSRHLQLRDGAQRVRHGLWAHLGGRRLHLQAQCLLQGPAGCPPQ
mmetsp:Transcript_116228/g.323689  ORF Transcript_116228/g.323689 Transcript_116228/m.323689 type:complete len:223 (-) Transcript_116228:793-1461(-)